MSWVPLQESGIAFGLQADVATLENSVVTLNDSGFSFWTLLDIVEPANLRVTVLSYTAASEFGITNQAQFNWGSTGEWQSNQTEDGSAFTPSPILTPITQEDIDLGAGRIDYSGASGSEWTVLETYGFLIEVEIDDAPGCDEIGRVSKANVSAFDRTRIHSTRLNPTERRCLVANFHGAIAASRTIVSATWQAEANASVALSGGAISADGRETNVMITAYRGPGTVTIQCTATLDNGEIYNQLFVAEIGWTPFQINNPAPSGQQTIVVNA